jgi:hypothetical protein
VTAAGGLPGSNRLDGGQPPGPQGGHQRGQRHQGTHSHRDRHVDPQRDVLNADLEQSCRDVQHRAGPQIARHGSQRQPGDGGRSDLGEVAGGDLPGGETDALKQADAPVAGHHRAADQGGHDQDRQHHPDQREHQYERRVDRLLTAGLIRRAQR